MISGRSCLARRVSSIEYLDRAAASGPGRDYKRRLLDALDPRPGHAVLDVGCGPGPDLGALADAVGPTGTVIGVDRDPAMVAESRRRFASRRVDIPAGDPLAPPREGRIDTSAGDAPAPPTRASVDIVAGDAHALPLADGRVDRARVDRVLQHVTSPRQALAELHRVLRPDGVLTLAEPDWDTLVIDSPDLASSRAFARFLRSRVRNDAIGRQLGRLATDVGFAVRALATVPITFTDIELGDRILQLRQNTERAVDAGWLSVGAAESWVRGLTEGPFLATFVLFTVTAVRAAGAG